VRRVDPDLAGAPLRHDDLAGRREIAAGHLGQVIGRIGARADGEIRLRRNAPFRQALQRGGRVLHDGDSGAVTHGVGGRCRLGPSAGGNDRGRARGYGRSAGGAMKTVQRRMHYRDPTPSGRTQRSKARKSVREKGKNSNGMATASSGAVTRRMFQGTSGQVAMVVASRLVMVTASAAMRLNQRAPRV